MPLAPPPPPPHQDAKRKAAELEDFGTEGVGAKTDADAAGDGTPAAKRSKGDREDGERRMLLFLEEVRAAKPETMSPEEAVATVQRLKEAHLDMSNAFIASALA